MAFKAKISQNKHHSHTVDQAIIEATKEDMVGFSIKLPKSTRSLFKSKTAMKNETMQDVLLRAITNYIEK